MAFEQKLAAVTPQAFTADGTALGIVTIANTTGLYIKQIVNLQSNIIPQALYQIKNVLSDTQVIVGPNNNSLTSDPKNRSDVSAYTVVDDATISAPEQNNFPIPDKDHYNAVYMPAPLAADRVVPVDPHGNFYNDSNPLPVAFDGTISIGDVTVVGTAPNHYPLEPNPDGSINVIVESVPSPNTTVVNTFNQALLVPSNATVSIVSYTIPAGKTAVLQKSAVSGDNIGQYSLLINSVAQDIVRTMFGGDLSQLFDFTSGNDSGLSLNAGDVIQIQVLNPRPYLGNYNARIQVLIIT